MAMRRDAVTAAGAPVAALARLRQGCYRMLSWSLLPPDEERLARLGPAVCEMTRRGRRGRLSTYLPSWKCMLEALEGFSVEAPSGLRASYARGFIGNSAQGNLYESFHTCNAPQEQGILLARLAQEYAASGVTPSPHSGEPEDHAAVELEFMAYLCSMEAEAWEREDVPQALQSLGAQAQFLGRHLTRFLPAAAAGVGDHSGDMPYGRILAAAGAFVLSDCDLVRALLQRFQGRSSPNGRGGSGAA